MKSNFILMLISVITINFFSGGKGNLAAQTIKSSNVKEIAVYKLNSDENQVLLPANINFNIKLPSVVDSLISSIDFSTPLDGSDLLTLTNAYVYIKFIDNSVCVFELSDLWRHIYKRGHPGRCYHISQNVAKLFEAHAQ